MDSGDDAEEGDESERQLKKKRGGSEEALKPRPLHKTASIFLRNLAPTITKQEVEAVSKQILLSYIALICRYCVN
jgi:RNA recognition motif-containing protein